MTWLVVACSGPGAMRAIERNESFAWIMLGVAAGIAVLALFIASMRKRINRWQWIGLGFAAVHPAIWMGARSGDCGRMLYTASIVWTVLVAVFAVFAIATALRGSRAPAE